MTSQSEREFFELAATYFKCRFLVMGGRIDGHPPVTSFKAMEWPLLGMVDYRHAMQHFVKEWKKNPNHTGRYQP